MAAGKKTKTKNKTKNLKNKVSGDSASFWKVIALFLAFVFIFTRLFTVSIKLKYDLFSFLPFKNKEKDSSAKVNEAVELSELEKEVIPQEGVELPIKWGDLGKRMIADGVIDEAKFRVLFKQGLSTEEQSLLSGQVDQKIVLTLENSRFLLDMLWAFGLANDNLILTDGQMTDEKYGGDASKFASTGGWSLSKGDVMNHYSAHSYVVLTAKQQDLVDRVSSNIYRPCCGNSTHFPDCNHGMAMLGLLQLMAANSLSEEEMYQVALKVNSYWFPQTYLDLAAYFKEQGQEWDEVDPKLALGSQYSSAQGYTQTRSKIKSLPTPAAGGGGCGV